MCLLWLLLQCCSKCSKCCGLLVVPIQSSYTFPSKCKCFSPFGNLVMFLLNFLALFLQLSFMWRCHMWYILPLLPQSCLLWSCHLWYLYSLSSCLYQYYWHCLYHCWHCKWFHSTPHHFLCPRICVFLFPLHS
jgi:hypothetical protein